MFRASWPIRESFGWEFRGLLPSRLSKPLGRGIEPDLLVSHLAVLVAGGFSLRSPLWSFHQEPACENHVRWFIVARFS